MDTPDSDSNIQSSRVYTEKEDFDSRTMLSSILLSQSRAESHEELAHEELALFEIEDRIKEHENPVDSKEKSHLYTIKKRITRITLLTYSFIVDFGLIFSDWFLDLSTGLLYFWKGEYTFGALSWTFPLVAGIICSIRLPSLLRKYRNAYMDFDFKILEFLSKVPSLQPVIFSYHVYKTEVRYYPMSPRWIPPHVPHLLEVTNHLRILEGVFEATPQAVLQIYIYFVGYETFANEGFELYFTLAKITLSLISTSRVCVKYWQQNIPYLFLPDEVKDVPEPQYTDYIAEYWRKLLEASLLLPFYLEAFTLSCVRTLTIVLALLMLSDAMASRLTMSFPEPRILIPFLTLLLILIIPRLVYSVLSWSRALFSAQLKRDWRKYGLNSKEEQIEQLNEYYIKFLKRGIFSIFAYPLYPEECILVSYVNVESAVVLWCYMYWYGIPSPYTASHYILSQPISAFVLSVCIRRLYEKFFLNRTKRRYLVAQRIVKECEMILKVIDLKHPCRFKDAQKLILNFTEFYIKRVLDKNFVPTQGIGNALREPDRIFEDFRFSLNDLTNSLISNYRPKIGENGNHLVYKDFPLWRLVHFVCTQVLIYYAKQHKPIFDKFNLHANIMRFKDFKSVNFDMSTQEKIVLMNFADILEPISRICVISFHTSPTFRYVPIQNFTKFEFRLERNSVEQPDIEKLRYVVDAVVAANKVNWNLNSLNTFLDLYITHEPEGQPSADTKYDDIPFLDDDEDKDEE